MLHLRFIFKFQKRRLGHIANFIRSCAPSESMEQVLQLVEKIEDSEPSQLFGETVDIDEGDAGLKTTKRGPERRRGKKVPARKTTRRKK